jgi:actin-like ATPase involved in cell morphogenesis
METDADRAYANYTCSWTFATWLSTTLRIAGEQFPEEIRSGLAASFDLSIYESEARRLREMYDRAWIKMQLLEDRIQMLEKELAEVTG